MSSSAATEGSSIQHAEAEDGEKATDQHVILVDEPNVEKECRCQRRWNVDDTTSRPSRHLLDSCSEKEKKLYIQTGVPLYKAALSGDLEKMQNILTNGGKNLLSSSLTEVYENALHVATGARQAAIVKELVGGMNVDDIKNQRDEIGNTAFCIAVIAGSVEIAEILMEKVEGVALTRGSGNHTSLYLAALSGHPQMCHFLYKEFEHHITHLSEDDQQNIFFAFIYNDLFDLAISIFERVEQQDSRRCSNLAWSIFDRETALQILARKSSAFGSKSSTMPKRLIEYFCHWFYNTSSESVQDAEIRKLTNLLCKYMSLHPTKSIKDTMDHVSNLVYDAAKLGNHEFLSVLCDFYPDLIFRLDKERGSIFHQAVLHRHASIFKSIHNFHMQKDQIMTYKVEGRGRYNMLQLAAEPPSFDRLNIVSGAALQMQSELYWFKEVEDLTPKSEISRNNDNLTPRELFTKEHEELRKAGEEWMKSTAGSCMLVVTLIAGAIFQTAASLASYAHEGNKTSFNVFTSSNVIAFCSSIISILVFLSILISRYAVDDFLFLLPLKLGIGLATLFLSLVSSMISFGTMFFLAYSKPTLTWVPLVSAVSFLAVVSLVMLEYRLLHDVFTSTFYCRFLFRPDKSSSLFKSYQKSRDVRS